MTFTDCLAKAAAEYGLQLATGQLEAFTMYYQLLIEWNEKMNLTAIREPEEVAVKHMVDSLTCYDPKYFPTGCRVMDVGTGAGFPGLPLKIFRPDIKLTLLDSLNKRLLFLQEVVQRLDLTGTVTVHSRAEEGARQPKYREQFDVALSRAVARLNVLTELCLPYVKTGGHFIALKGAQYQQETEEAAAAIRVLGGRLAETRPVTLPGLPDSRAVIYIKKIKPTVAAYPRRPGQPEKKPL
ncbi:16S rRNA (guanine(527)-N(7))-methyltransferase RsmG [Acetonema longum]|uniref:Ribosomal RNA small subunit methyltransferase G n=1 Tax=Acetonema longum DSM 6540 TaxID=1009370 RepID=F7NFX1_9FIRM|nr:16S rRNA (guanine(527)-N(7))-methyltransferase RsmG [Acetonema longum]EGO65079.1 methyltransferase GidB [Acetonema longum DSM 6540]